MKIIFGHWFLGLILMPFISLKAQNAPVTTVENVVTMHESVTVKVMANSFTGIASCELQLLYDPAIALATAVTNTSLLGGNINTDLTIPGIILLGWYAYPGVTLPDSSVIFTIDFIKVTAGTSLLSWFDDGYSCYYSDESTEILNDIPTSVYYRDGSVTFVGKAPGTIAPVLESNPASTVEIPVKVTGFKDVGKIKLTLKYDSAVLSFRSYDNTSGFPGLSIQAMDPGTILAEGVAESAVPATTLADSSVLFTLQCLYKGGTTALEWNTESESCIYYGLPPDYPKLVGLPAGSYYFNGSVMPAAGMADPSKSRLHLSVFPNPVSGYGILTWYMPSPGKVYVMISNMPGKKMIHCEKYCDLPGEQKLAIVADRFTPGIYIARIIVKTKTENFSESIKLIYN